MVLRFAVAKSWSTLEIDKIGELLLVGELLGGKGDDGPLISPNAAGEELQSASLRASMVLGDLEEELSDMELAWRG